MKLYQASDCNLVCLGQLLCDSAHFDQVKSVCGCVCVLEKLEFYNFMNLFDEKLRAMLLIDTPRHSGIFIFNQVPPTLL